MMRIIMLNDERSNDISATGAGLAGFGFIKVLVVEQKWGGGGGGIIRPTSESSQEARIVQ